MNVKIVKSVKDDFSESSGPSTVTHAFLSLDGFLFELGRFYEGPHMNDGTSERLNKILELEREYNRTESTNKLYESMFEKIRQLDPEFSRELDKKFWDLI